MSNWEDLEKELLSDPATKREFDRLAPRYAVISQLIAARNKKGLTQAQLAKKMGTRQSAIARFESGNVNPTIGFLDKAASTLGAKLTISLQ